MKLNKAFALRVKELLKEKKMTQYKLAQETGLYHSTMTDILNCKYETPNFSILTSNNTFLDSFR